MVAKLIVASGKSAGRSIALKHGKLLIGRADECDIRPLGDEVSRRHCEVRVDGDALASRAATAPTSTAPRSRRRPA